MRRHGRGRGRRGAHRAEPTGSGPLATVGHVLGSTVPKRVSPPRPLRVAVVSGAIVGALLFSYSTTQIYLRFTEPDQTPPAPSVTTSAAPPTDGHGSLRQRSPRKWRSPWGAEESSALSRQDAPDGTERTAPVPDPEKRLPPGGHQSFPVPQSAPGTPRVSSENRLRRDPFHGACDDHQRQRCRGGELGTASEVQRRPHRLRLGHRMGTGPRRFIARQPHWSNGIPRGSPSPSASRRGAPVTPRKLLVNGVPCPRERQAVCLPARGTPLPHTAQKTIERHDSSSVTLDDGAHAECALKGHSETIDFARLDAGGAHVQPLRRTPPGYGQSGCSVQRRRVRRCECEIRFPNPGPLLQMSQTKPR